MLVDQRHLDTRSESGEPRVRHAWDWAGGTVSGLCGVHCVATTAWVLLNPSIWLSGWQAGWGIWFLWAEWAFAGTAALVATVAMARGYRRHRRLPPGALTVVGLLTLILGVLSPWHRLGPWGSGVVLLGGMVLIGAHVLNARLPAASVQTGSHSTT